MTTTTVSTDTVYNVTVTGTPVDSNGNPLCGETAGGDTGDLGTDAILVALATIQLCDVTGQRTQR